MITTPRAWSHDYEALKQRSCTTREAPEVQATLRSCEWSMASKHQQPGHSRLPCSTTAYVCDRHCTSAVDPLLKTSRASRFAQSRRGTQTKKDSHAPRVLSAFEALPTELILHISTSLDAPSTACLALSSKHLSQVLGSQAWESLSSQKTAWQDQEPLSIFLSTYARDHASRYWYCSTHHRLHPRESLLIEPCCKALARADERGHRWPARKTTYASNPGWYKRTTSSIRSPFFHPTLLLIHQFLHHDLCPDTLACSGHFIRPLDAPAWTPHNPSATPSSISTTLDTPSPHLTLFYTTTPWISKTGSLRLKTRYTFTRHGAFSLPTAIMATDFPLCKHVRIGHAPPTSPSKPAARSRSLSALLPSLLSPHLNPRDQRSTSAIARISLLDPNIWPGAIAGCAHCRTELTIHLDQPWGETQIPTAGRTMTVAVWQTVNPRQIRGMEVVDELLSRVMPVVGDEGLTILRQF